MKIAETSGELDKVLIEEFVDNLLNRYTSPIFNTFSCEYKYTEAQINLIIRPQCNQSCEYCYIYQRGDQLYPNRPPSEEILNNVRMCIDYVVHQKKFIPLTWELFAGDLFYDGLFFDVLDIFIEEMSKVKEKFPEIFQANSHFSTISNDKIIIVPSNLRFVYEKPEYVDKVLDYMKVLKEKFGYRVMFSWSSDGPYCTDVREKTTLPDDYWDKIFDFCVKTESGPHPMVAPENVKYWKENYIWWLDWMKRLNEATNYKGDHAPMMLEVRNGYWTDENIQDYCDLLEFMFNKKIELCNNDLERFAYWEFENPIDDESPIKQGQYDPIHWIHTGLSSDGIDAPGCSAFSGIHFNCLDLSLELCHRLTYKQFKPLYFVTNEDNTKIIGIKPHNVNAFIAFNTLKENSQPMCNSCFLRLFCLKGCYGSQFEDSGELFLPIPNVCNFFYHKYKKLLELYDNYHIFEIAKEHNYIPEQFYDDIQLLKQQYKEGFKAYDVRKNAFF